MRFSSLGLAALAAVLGCTPAVTTPPPRAAAASPVVPGGSKAPASSPVAPATVAAAVSGALDSTEEITPGELASIPDPVPGSEAGAERSVQDAAEAPTGAIADPPIPDPGPAIGAGAGAAAGSTARDGRRSIWRVQVYASPDLSQAGRVAKEASARLGEPAVVEFEDPLYKVRLGNFSSEALAQALRERAISEGYTGAFRMKASEPANEIAR